MIQTIRNFPFAVKGGLWLAWLLSCLAVFTFFEWDQVSLMREPQPADTNLVIFFFPMWIASAVGLWLLLRLDKRDTLMASVAAGLVATIVTLFVGMPVLYVVISFVWGTFGRIAQ